MKTSREAFEEKLPVPEGLEYYEKGNRYVIAVNDDYWFESEGTAIVNKYNGAWDGWQACEKHKEAEIAELRAENEELKKALIESQDWNWLSAKEHAEENGLGRLDIDEMQRLYEIAHG